MALIQSFADFRHEIAPRGALLALDVSPSTIGIAISDFERHISSPFKTLKRTRFQHDAQQLIAIINSEKIAGIIVGMPLNMDGTIGARAQSCRSFALNLSRLTPCPIGLYDERLSTAEAHDRLDDLQANANLRKQSIDQIAAQIILSRALQELLP